MRPVALVAVLLVAACQPEEELRRPVVARQPRFDLDAHEVSILYPLGPGLLAPEGLLPRERFAALPQLEFRQDGYDTLRLVALRIDPAAGEPQIRAVWQPIHDGRAADAAVQTFYRLAPGEIETVLEEVVALRAGRPRTGAALGVHPILAAEGLDGPYARGLAELIRRHAGAQNLVRVTFMTLRGNGDQWELGGFDVDLDGHLRPMVIPQTGGARLQVLRVHPDRRAFGWFGTRPAISQRTANETAAALDWVMDEL